MENHHKEMQDNATTPFVVICVLISQGVLPLCMTGGGILHIFVPTVL